MNLKIWCYVFFLFFPHQVHAHCTLKQQNSWQRVGHLHWKRNEMFELYLCFRYQFKPLTGISVTPLKDLSLTVMTKRQEVQCGQGKSTNHVIWLSTTIFKDQFSQGSQQGLNSHNADFTVTAIPRGGRIMCFTLYHIRRLFAEREHLTWYTV